MDLATVITLTIGAAAAIFAGWQGYETRRQRLIAEASNSPTQPAPPEPALREWICGVYDYPPLSIVPSNSGEGPSGILVDLALEVFGKLGQPFKLVQFNYDGFYDDEARIPDAVIGMFETRRRGQRMKFSRPVYEIGLQGICRADLEGDVLDGLRCGDLRLAVYSGEVGWEFLVEELPDAVEENRYAIVTGGRARDTMSLLENGTYDVVLMDEVSCLKFLREGNNSDRFKLAFSHPPQTFDTCIAVKPIHAAHLKAIDEELSRVRNTTWFLEREARALTGFETAVARRGLRRPQGSR